MPFVRFLLFLLIIAAALFFVSALPLAAPTPPTPTTSPKEEVESAVQEAIGQERETVLGLLLNEVRITETRISEDSQWAVSFLSMFDPETGEVIPGEPGLAISQQRQAGWAATLPADLGWSELVEAVPSDILPDEQKQAFLDLNSQSIQAAPVAPIGGYLLPWEAGKTVYLSQSTGHDQYIPSGSAHYSFDFYVPQTMYRLFASKAGIVWRARWDVPNGDDSGVGNYLVIQDSSTNPVTYQLYLHLAQDSIPEALRNQGAFVAQGQFIGIADDTGQSTGHHLHFQVHTNPDSYWGTSVDIVFSDVDINGGRPRRTSDLPYCTRPDDVCNEFRTSYVSGNTVHGDLTPPTGGLFEPSTGSRATSRVLFVEGYATDIGSGVNKARFIAYYENSWHVIGGEYSTLTFSYNWDMCTGAVPDGPVSLALQIWDNEGNPATGLPGLTHFTKDYDCNPPPPVCPPGDNQVALFTNPDYQGRCASFGIGDYPDPAALAGLGDNEIESILVGKDVLATLFSDASFLGRGDTFSKSDSNIGDDPVGSNQASSLIVRPLTDPPSVPAVLLYPQNGATLVGGSSLSLSWRDSGRATAFQAQLVGPFGTKTSGWLNDPVWHLDEMLLSQGSYTWKVRARNCPDTSCQSAWSNPSSFTVSAIPTPPSSVSAPFFDNIENGTNGWTASGLWNRFNDASLAKSGTFTWYFGDPASRTYQGGAPAGDLTSRPITLSSTNYLLRFWYRYDTESPEKRWDQRWVQISIDNGPYVNVLQLFDDVSNEWLRATIDLSNYAGKTIRIRFHFEALDANLNQYTGWLLDDVEITASSLPACKDNDNTPSNATIITYGQEVDRLICPDGDVDYFRFEGVAGDRIVADIDTPTENPPKDLDLILFLLDNDGRSVLAIHDDEETSIRLDPHLGYKLTRSGTYYLKARLWSHPSIGGNNYTYSLRLSKDLRKPNATFSYPATGDFIPGNSPITLTVSASDTDSGVRRVEFLYHSRDWTSTSWQILGIDNNDQDGWTWEFDPALASEGSDYAFYANVYDWAGNWFGTGSWTIGLDRIPPTTSLKPLSATQPSTAVLLEWTGSDGFSGIDHFELQSQIGTSTWNDYSPDPAGNVSQTWFIAASNNNYGFRLRGVDRVGNSEDFPSAAETRTSIPNIATLCSSPDTWDNGSNDNSPSTAPFLAVGSPAQLHNYCNPLTSDRLNDEDWVNFTVQKGQTYMISSFPAAVMTATKLTLYAADGNTEIVTIDPPAFSQPTQLIWTADRNGKVFLRNRHVDGRVAGNVVAYELTVRLVKPLFIPMIYR